MAENENNVRAEEETQEPEVNQDEQTVGKIETEKSSLDADFKDVEEMSDQQRGKKEIEGQITKNLKDLGNRLENYKKVLFLRMLKARGEDVEIPEDQGDIAIDEKYAEEFATYSKEPISTEDLMAPDSPYTAAKNQLIGTLRNRENKLNDLIGKSEEVGRIQNLLEETNSKLDSFKAERDNPETTPERKEELEGLIGRLEAVKEGIEGKDISNSRGDSHKFGLLDKAQKAARQHMTVKREALKALGQQVAPYAKDGASFVYDDKDITDSIGKYDAERDRLENIVKNTPTQEAPENGEKTEPTEPEEKTEGTENVERTDGENNNQPKANGNGKAAPNAQNVQAAPVQGIEQVAQQRQFITPEDVMAGNIPQDRLSSIFGITNLSTLDRNYDGAWDVLDMFSSQAIPDKTRLAMLNDPKSRQIIMKAFEEVGTFHPFKGMEHLDTRKSILKLKGPLMEQALKSMPELGLNLSDTKKIADIYKSLPERFEKYEAKINGDTSLTSEEKKAKLEELNKYRDTFSNVNLFQQVKGRVRSPRTLLTELKDYMSDKFSKKGNLQMLSEGSEIESKRREEELNRRFDSQEREQEAPVQETPVVEEKQQPVNDFQARNAGLVNKVDQAVISEETREAKKQEQLAKETQNKNEINQKGEDGNTPTAPGE